VVALVSLGILAAVLALPLLVLAHSRLGGAGTQVHAACGGGAAAVALNALGDAGDQVQLPAGSDAQLRKALQDAGIDPESLPDAGAAASGADLRQVQTAQVDVATLEKALSASGCAR
jgi:hypothetical protein